MPANITPIFPKTPTIGFCKLTTAVTDKDGVGATVLLTASENGAKIDQIKARAKGTNVATVLRIFISSGDPSQAANNVLIHEVTLPATTLNEAAALSDFDITITKDGNLTVSPIPYLPAGYKLLVALGTAVAAGWAICVWGGEY